jgi:acetyltransferase-like isoleucine patch superfamily enzyme
LRERFPNATIEDGVTIINPDRLELGDGALIQTGAVLHCGGYAWSQGRGSIKIGGGAVIAQHCVLYGAGEIDIGEGFYCGPDCMIFSSQERIDFADGSPDADASHLLAKTTLEDESRLGVAAIVAHGVTLGRGSILGGNSLLLAETQVPPMELWAGTPARKVKDLNPDTWRSPRLNA